MSEKTAQLTLQDTSIDLPVRSGTIGPSAIDITSLYKNNIYTYDSGFMSTAACESKITFIDGEKGILLYRGYPIEQLAEYSDFVEVCYLLLYGELPNRKQKEEFTTTVTQHRMVHEQIRSFFNGFRRDAHPMAILMGVVGALSAFYHDSSDINNSEHRHTAAIRLIGKMPTIAAMCYKYSLGQPFIYPEDDLNYAENFLHMMFSTPCKKSEPDPVLSKAMDRILILHADHEQNASTSTVRLAGSTGANPFACISAGIGALWGPAHGGANEAALNMLKEIGDESRIGEFIRRAKDPQDTFRLMGFGHRVYKNYDPRAKIMQQTCYEVLDRVGAHDAPLFKLAMKLEKIALEDDYFISKKLYPNIDFYSGLTLSAMGFPTSMFTVIFAIARTIGWISHWNEMISSNERRIGRPRQIYTGSPQRDFIALKKR